MTYDQVMLAEDDPFDVSYAWLHLGKMDTRYYKVFLVVDLDGERFARIDELDH